VPRLSVVSAQVGHGPGVPRTPVWAEVQAEVRIAALVPTSAPGPFGRLAVVADGPGTVVVSEEGVAGTVQGRSLLGTVPAAGPTAVAFRVPWRHVSEWSGERDGPPGAMGTIEVLGTDPPFAVTLRGARFPRDGPSGMLGP